MRKIIFTLLLCTPFFFANAAGKKVSLLMDSETIQWLEDISAPLRKIAKIPDGQVTFHLLADDEVNAFVNERNDMFMNTGLILKAETPEEVLGVLAHELGHVQGKHIFSTRQNQGKFTLPALISGVLGVGAAAAGSPDAAGALILGGQALGQTGLIRHTRVHEREADQRAFSMLNQAGYSTEGMITFFKKLKGQELFYSQKPPQYLLTHPYSDARRDSAKSHFDEKEPLILGTEPSHLSKEKFELIKARVYAVTNTPMKTVRKYGNNDKISAKYATAIAYVLSSQFEKAQKLANELLENDSNNPYYYELIAYMAGQAGDIDKAVVNYAKSVELSPENELLRLQYGKFLVANNNYNLAIINLLRVVQEQPTWANAWRLLGVSYGKQQKLGLSHVALAEESLLLGRKSDAKMHLKVVEKHLKKDENPQAWQRFRAIESILEQGK